jgi:predicted dehydrogenase
MSQGENAMIDRRTALLAALAPWLQGSYQPSRSYRAAIIGHSGRGDYGHGWDTAWNRFTSIQVVAVADPDDAGRKLAMSRSKALRGYRDYREMLARERPELVAICPRWADQRVDMVRAAAGCGAHILMEKPFARNLAEADAMIEIAESRKIKIQVGHTARIMPVTRLVRELVLSGGLGQVIEARARGKEDKRAGGEDLIVLGTHTFDLWRHLLGDPLWVFAHVMEKGAGLRPAMLREASEPVGKIGGDNIAAMFAFHNGVCAYFGSMANDGPPSRRFGATFYCSRGFVYVPLTAVPSAAPYVLRDPAWLGDHDGPKWERLGYPPGERFATREDANHAMAADLLRAIESGSEPVCSARDGRWAIEMVVGIYESQFLRGPVPFPLRKRIG